MQDFYQYTYNYTTVLLTLPLQNELLACTCDVLYPQDSHFSTFTGIIITHFHSVKEIKKKVSVLIKAH